MILKFKNIFFNEVKRTQNHIFITPHKLLKHYIAHYTISFSSNDIVSIPDTLTLIPDGSGCLVFTFDGNFFGSKIYGATTKTVIVKNDVNACPMRLFIEFLPCGLYYFTGIKQMDLTDLILSLNDVNSKLHFCILEAFEMSQNLDIFIQKLNYVLISFIKNNNIPYTLLSSVKRLKLSNGIMSVKELSNLEFYSERHLNRIFNEYMGINTKTFSRIIRVNMSIQQMKNRNFVLSTLAQDMGFYDQSHFIHDFKYICGTTPKNYLLTMSDFYNEPLKF